MRCTSNNTVLHSNVQGRNRRRRNMRRRNRRKRMVRILIAGILCLVLLAAIVLAIKFGFRNDYGQAALFEQTNYNKSIYKGNTFAENLCVAETDVALDGFTEDPDLHAAALFDLNSKKVLYSDKVYDKLFPASTTKVMTAYLILKYGNLDDIVTVSSNATGFANDEVVCGLETGDTLTLYDLLCGIILHSGNDAAAAAAEHVGGSIGEFANMMNEEAYALGATGTHFVNPHGLQDEDHYTTAYDLYLMFNACIQDQRFLDIISMKSYTGTMTGADGTVRTATWLPTNYYSLGEAYAPDGVSVWGGKTGTTDEAGSCVILYSQDMQNNPYISVIMGAEDKTVLYNDMTNLLSAGVSQSQSSAAED